MRKAFVLMLMLAACGDGGAPSVLVPNVLASYFQGLASTRSYDAVLSVVCSGGASADIHAGFEGDAEVIAFFGVPPCGDATMDLTVDTLYGNADPVMTFKADATAPVSLRVGNSENVSFTGSVYGEIVLAPNILDGTICYLTNDRDETLEVDLNGAPARQSLPKGTYSVACYEPSNSIPFNDTVSVTAGGRENPEITFVTSRGGSVPQITTTPGLDATAIGVTVTFGYNTGSDASTFSVLAELSGDAGFTQQAAPSQRKASTQFTFTALEPGTHYYLRLTPQSSVGVGDVRTLEFDTESADCPLSVYTFNGTTPTGFAVGNGGAYVMSYGQLDIVAFTEDPDDQLSFDGVTWSDGTIAQSYTPPAGFSSATVYARRRGLSTYTTYTTTIYVSG